MHINIFKMYTVCVYGTGYKYAWQDFLVFELLLHWMTFKWVSINQGKKCMTDIFFAQINKIVQDTF